MWIILKLDLGRIFFDPSSLFTAFAEIKIYVKYGVLVVWNHHLKSESFSDLLLKYAYYDKKENRDEKVVSDVACLLYV